MATSTTRGVSFDPKTAAAQRAPKVRVVTPKPVSPMKYAIMLDQIEKCYRQHTPPQLQGAAA